MNKIYFIIIMLLIFIGCVSQQPDPIFEYSNQQFLERVISRINLSAELDGKISTKYRLSIHSIEPVKRGSRYIISIIEDHLISSLIDNDYILFERDTIALKNLINESDEKLTLPPLNPISTFDNENNINQLKTHINSSEISIFFRLLEAAIIFQKHPDDRGYIERVGIARIHVRIHNTQTGEILFTSNLTGKLTDSVPKEISDQMVGFNYTYLPLEKE